MKFLQQIVLRLVIPLTVGMLALGAAVIALVYTQSGSWIFDIGTTIETIQLDSFLARTKLKSGFTQSVISSFILDLHNLAEYAAIALSGDPEISVIRPYKSYFRTMLDTEPEKPAAGTESLYSSYFNINVTTSSVLATFGGSMNSTILDNILRPVKMDKYAIELAYFGFPDYGFRSYPYIYNESSSADFKTNRYCPEGDGRIGFVPECRDWYKQAKNAAQNSTETFGPVIVGTPYRSASKKAITITASKAIKLNGILRTIAGVDVTFEGFIDSFQRRNTILKNGFTFLMSSKGNLVVYNNQRLRREDILTRELNIAEIEFSNNFNAANEFIKVVNTRALLNDSSQIDFAGETWKVAASYVSGTDFMVVGLVPVKDVISPSQQMRDRTFTFSLTVSIIVAVALVVSTVSSYFLSHWFAMQVLRPVRDLRTILESIGRNQLDIELTDRGDLSKELNMIQKHFGNLLVAVRFGNDAYYSGELSKALENYEAAERMMDEFRNERGKGVCQNNIGNVYSQMDRLYEAETAYNLSIKNAERVIEAETDPERLKQYRDVLADRLMNLGALRRIEGSFDAARDLFERALNIYRRNDNLEGITRVCGNMGQLCIQLDQIDEAEELINDVLHSVKRSGQPIATQYAFMNKGLLCVAQGKKQEALAWFLFVLQKFAVVVSYVQHSCAQNVINLCMDPAINKPALAKRIVATGLTVFRDLHIPEHTAANPLNPSLTNYQDDVSSGSGTFVSVLSLQKDLAFALDVSASMSGAPIRSCRKSIVEIIEYHTGDTDRIRMLTFDKNTTTLFNWTFATEENKILMRMKVDKQTECDGVDSNGTALWDALLTSITSMNSDPNTLQWVCALTDGFDNASRHDHSEVLAALRKHRDVGLIAIAVGDAVNEQQIKEVCEHSRGGGFYIKANSDGLSIEQAFRSAKDHIRQMMDLKMQDIMKRRAK